MWGLTSLARDWTSSPALKDELSTTGPPGKSPSGCSDFILEWLTVPLDFVGVLCDVAERLFRRRQLSWSCGIFKFVCGCRMVLLGDKSGVLSLWAWVAHWATVLERGNRKESRLERMVLGVMSLQSWQNIKGKPLEKQDWGSGESKGQEGLGSGYLPNIFRWQCFGKCGFWLEWVECTRTHTHTLTHTHTPLPLKAERINCVNPSWTEFNRKFPRVIGMA